MAERFYPTYEFDTSRSFLHIRDGVARFEKVEADVIVVDGKADTAQSSADAAQADADAAQADADQAIADAAAAQATADGKVTTFFQAGAPTAEGVGDLWVDTDDGDHLYRWDGTQWVDVQDADIQQAISDAATAQSTADSKIVSFYQTTAPTAEGVGDLWVDTDDGDRLHRWDGSAWVDVHDAAIDAAQADADQALADAASAQATADGKVTTYFQNAEPTAEAVGDLWVDTDDGDRLHRWDGSTWVDIHDAEIDQAISDAANAQSTADGKIVTFYQAAAPTAEATGDLWVDTDNGDRLYRWDGASWIDVHDQAIDAAQADADQALVDASNAQATADGKVTTFFQTTAPTAEAVGDLWADTDDGNRLYRWDGSAWADVQDADIQQALSDAATAQSTADSKIVTHYQAAAPTAEAVGDLWVDTDNGDRLYRWDGSTWVDVHDQAIDAAQADASQAITDAANAQATADGKVTTFFQATAPTAEGVGDLWADTDDGHHLYRWDGTNWVDAQDTDIQQALSDASNAQATADSKIVTYYQTAAPTAKATGDLWVDTDNGDRLYRWDGTAWIDVHDTAIDTAQSSADDANSTLDTWAYDGTRTTIAGGNIQAGTVTAQELAALTIEVGKHIESSSYSAGASGWIVHGDGSAEFNDVTVRGILDTRDSNGTGMVAQDNAIGMYYQGTDVGSISVNTLTPYGIAYNASTGRHNFYTASFAVPRMIIDDTDGVQIDSNLNVGLDVDVGREIFVEAGSYHHRIYAENLANGSTLTVRPSNNPDAGSDMFRVMSSGGALRFSVDHSGWTRVHDSLQVDGNLYVQGSIARLRFNVPNGHAGDARIMFSGTSEDERLLFSDNADRYYFSADGPTNYSKSELYAGGYTVASDGSMKQDVRDLDVGLDFVRSLRARDWETIPSQKKPSTKRMAGFVAQEVATAKGERRWPGVVEPKGGDEPDGGRYALDVMSFVAALVKAVQELTDRVEAIGG